MSKEFKSLEYYKSLHWDYNILFSEEEKTYALYLKDNDLSFSAESPEQLIKLLPVKIDEWLKNKISGKNKNSEIIEPLNLGDCNGRLNIKVSQSLHYKLLQNAVMEGLTINHLVNDILNSYYGKFSKARYTKKDYTPDNTLAVVNCATTLDEVRKFNIYACGTAGVGQTFKKFKYFGAYQNKNVSDLFEVRAVIDIEKTNDLKNAKCQVYWKNVNDDNEKLFKEVLSIIAKDERRRGELASFANRVFLLSNHIKDVTFKKDTHGGLYGTKKYFNDIATGCKNIQEFAEKINDKSWSEFDTSKIVDEQE